ncbi:conserved hypothetical protein [Methanosalsum zhilinae DSM 4017]|uniref:DUF2209 domain-containing protein n=1 Tax=Methanosalsum zhilinae (strain DSM 4017 / NBRC 107636 / OCM 62 / WeN5) TaxID=679901 RepID=F7XLE5_METZD|nr:DUF2209 domain-containing protein [Methanosalsum zhilinae]AEH60339.1 conserved hypothetical protein [Methanosalsum zhilinae DSM 4017]
MRDIVAVDISGRHRTSRGHYYIVCAAVSLSVSPDHIEKIHQVNTKAFRMYRPLKVLDVVQIIEKTVSNIKREGVIVTEKGDMYNKPLNFVSSRFKGEFKYQESISERLAVQLAHHISLSSRKLLVQELDKI